MKNRHFKLFPDCKVVDGYKRSLIVDLTRERYLLIPHALSEIVTRFNGKTMEEVYSFYSESDRLIVDEYFVFLEKNELIFWCEEHEVANFPDINFDWQWPAIATNSIIDLDETSSHNFEDIFLQLASLNCQDIQIRSYTIKEVSYWDSILAMLLNSRIKSVEIITPWYKDFSNEEITNLLQKHLRLRSLFFHSSPITHILLDGDSKMGMFALITDCIDSNVHCGQIHPDYFNVNIKLFSESQTYNTCLNRKVSIDVNGDIKNCPSMSNNYGNIKDRTLREAMNSEQFKSKWIIAKDQIEVCKDCEFRHICTDCRVYTANVHQLNSKPSKCNYNPYLAIWET